MPRRPALSARWLTAASWPAGIALTSWDYMWRSTVLHRGEALAPGDAGHLPPVFPDHVDPSEVQGLDSGYGPLYHRRYSTKIRQSRLGPDQLFERLIVDLNQAAPTKFARFQRVYGDAETMRLGDEFVVRMPGPWDGPVRVIALGPRTFRLATLAGHLEAGQIEFRVGQDELLSFEIESWARSSGRFSNLLYHHVRMAKEIQLHMWISFLEGVVSLAGGRMTGGIRIDTRRIENGYGT